MTGQTLSEFFSKIYDDTYRPTLAYVTAHAGRFEDIPDIMQETYAELYRVISKKGRDFAREPAAFVKHIAKTRLSRFYKKHTPELAIIEDADFFEPALTELDDSLLNSALIDEINRFLEQKPLSTRKIFTLHFYFDMTLEEIASELGISLSAVKNRLYRSIAELRRLYMTD